MTWRRAWTWLAGALLLAAAVGGALWLRSRAALPSAGTVMSEPAASADERHARLREEMVTSQIVARGVSDTSVLAAMRAVPRHEYVSADSLSQAYVDHPLGIGYGQTISQPYIVALMTELLALSPGDNVLEIGAGSGYQAAVLAQITTRVTSIEIVPELCEQASSRLGESVKVICADGYYGYPEGAPYDGIIVTCAPDHIPQPLVAQLADGGRMVIPVGPPGMYQVLLLLEKQGEKVTSREIGDVSFVPLVRASR